jgi:hypothetical protein
LANELTLVGGQREGGEGGGGGYSSAKSGGAKASGGFDQRVPEHEEAPAHSTGEITDEDIPF